MKHILWAVLGGLIISASVFSAGQPFIDVRVQTDRSALWVGDRFHELITVVHDPQVRFVMDNIEAATVNLEPFQILDLQYHEAPAADGRQKLEIVLLLTTYEAEARELQIPSINLFYFVESATSTNSDRTAETLTVPAATVLLQSTVPQSVASIRDGSSPPATPFRYRATFPIALGMLVLALASVAPLFIHGKRLRREQERSRRRKAALEQMRSSAAALASRSVDSESRMTELYEETNQKLREYLSAISVLPTEGKSPRELSSILLSGNGATGVMPSQQVKEIVAILEACERVRYAPNEFLVGTKLHPELIERLRALAG